MRVRQSLPWAVGVLALLALVAAGALIAARGRPEDAPDVLIRRAQEAIAAKRWDEAATHLDRLAGSRTRRAAIDYLAAQLDDARGDQEAALAALARVPDDDRLAARARLLAGQIERKRDRARAAEAELIQAVRLDPGLSQARRELAFLYGIQGRRADMDAQFRALSRLVPLDMNGVFLWTNCNEDVVFNIANRPILERFLAADPGDRWSRLALAEVMFSSGQLEDSEAMLAPLPEGDVGAISIRARMRIQQAQMEEASRLLALGPEEEPSLAYLRGQMVLNRRDPATAAQLFRTALDYDPAHREAVVGLSVALHALGQEAESVALRRRAEDMRNLSNLLLEGFEHLERGSRDPSLPRRLGAACEAVGRPEVARSWYRVALGLDPDNPRIRSALERLRTAAP
ncbi:MAG: tetratricopeptide repeat protein [Isosphaeraceae bacterium]